LPRCCPVNTSAAPHNKHLTRQAHHKVAILTTECWHTGADMTGALHVLLYQLAQPAPSPLATDNPELFDILVPVYPGFLHTRH